MTNIADNGFEAEEGRAAIHRYDIASGRCEDLRLAACAIPSASPSSRRPGVLWTVVNERDGLGDETPPDYLTSVSEGGFYGWPYCYWDRVVDDRVPPIPAMVAKAIQPDYALGGHTASLGLCWMPAGVLPGFGDGHGHRPARLVEPQHAQRLSRRACAVRERPAGRAAARHSLGLPLRRRSLSPTAGRSASRSEPDKSLLVADDVGDVVWRVTGA